MFYVLHEKKILGQTDCSLWINGCYIQKDIVYELNMMCVLSAENHILEDVNKCVIALQEGDVDTLDRTAGAIRGRAARVIHIINAEMENYETGVYTEKVLEATKLLSETGKLIQNNLSERSPFLPFQIYIFKMGIRALQMNDVTTE